MIQLTAIKGKQEHLQNTERSSSEVEEDVTDAPTHSALPAEVHHSLPWDIENQSQNTGLSSCYEVSFSYLRYVLDERDKELVVGEIVEVLEPRDGSNTCKD